MPYLKPKDRLATAIRGSATSPGELNYLITNLCLDYILREGEGYETYNAAIGAIECTKLELYRRALAPYEDIKANENGDLYEE